jgi:hypothetical protein
VRAHPRHTTRERPARPRRTPASGARPAAPIDPYTSLALDLTNVPHHLLIGEAIPEAHLRIYERLFNLGILPALPRKAADTTVGYLSRCVQQFGEGTDLTLSSLVLGHTNTQSFKPRAANPKQQACLYATFEADERRYLEAGAYAAALHRASPRLAATVFNLAGTWSNNQLNVIGPEMIAHLADAYRYSDDDDWWAERREEIAQAQGVAPEALSQRDLDEALAEHGIISPDQFRESLHGARAKSGRVLGHRNVATAIAALPNGLREITRFVHEQMLGLRAANMKLAALTRIEPLDDDEREMYSDTMADPTIVIDTSLQDDDEERSPISELLDEAYQMDAQSEGWGPFLILRCVDADRSCRTIVQAIELIGQAEDHADQLQHAFSAWRETTATKKRKKR